MQVILDRVFLSTKFKVGAARGPEHRWLNPTYGYFVKSRWRFMHLVFRGTAEEASSLETRLITWAKAVYPKDGERGCQNKAPGGESIREAGGWWVYVVFETDPDYPRTALARQLQDVHVSTCAFCASADTDEDSF
jgi:hypothetical protein